MRVSIRLGDVLTIIAGTVLGTIVGTLIGGFRWQLILIAFLGSLLGFWVAKTA